MSRQSLHTKLFWTALAGAALVLSLLLAFISFSGYRLTAGNAVKFANDFADNNAHRIGAELGNAWAVATALTETARTLHNQHADRALTDAVTRQILEANPQLLGLGHYWDADAYDGADAAHANQPGYDDSGRYALYWNRTQGALKADPLKTELHPLRSGQPWVSEPSAYTTSTGQKVTKVSLMQPLQQEGKTLGAAGVDLPLQAISEQLAAIKIFDSQVALVSSDGRYASHPDSQRLAQPADDLPTPALQAIKAGQPYTASQGDINYVIRPVHIGNATNAWALVVNYSQGAVLAKFYTLLYIAFGSGLVALLLLALVLWNLLGWQLRPLIGLTHSIQGWQGELGLRLEQRSADETGKLAGAFNQFIGRLTDLVGSIRHSSGTLMQVSQHLEHTTQAVVDRATTQHSATQEMALGITNLAQSVTEMARQTEDVEQLARSAESLTSRIAQDMGQTVGEIGQIDRTMGVVTETVGRLEERSQQIAGIIDVIRGIAEQTNLLALNAAIEAARAGEQGRGFAVVADEVRNLAERTSRSTHEIGEMISAIGSDVRHTVTDVQQVGSAMRLGVDQLSASAAGVEQIRQHAQNILLRISEVARQTQSQSATGEQLSVSIQDVRNTSEQNDQAIRSLLEQSNQLRNQANALSAQLAEFRQ